MHYLFNILWLPYIFFRLYFATKKQKAFQQKTILTDVESIHPDNSISDEDLRKIKKYYGLAVPTILGESFCILRHKKMTEKERICLSYMGAMTGLFDDFFDEDNLDEERLVALMKVPSTVMPRNKREELFLLFAQKCYQAMEEKELLEKHQMRVFESQKLSHTQRDQTITSEQIRHITFLKGGESILFYRTALQPIMTESESKMCFQLGALGQLSNDIFDIYKDQVQGIKTLATSSTNFIELKEEFLQLQKKCGVLIAQTQFKNRNKRIFQCIIALISCRALVCLDMLINLQANSKKPFSLKNFNRKDLICDMALLKNQRKLIHYYALGL